MKQAIIAFKSFNSTGEFEKWQEARPRQIINMNPVPISAVGKAENMDTANCNIQMGIYVTYVKKEATK